MVLHYFVSDQGVERVAPEQGEDAFENPDDPEEIVNSDNDSECDLFD